MIEAISGFFNDIINAVLMLLPDSPFQFVSQTAFIYKYLQWINWVIPFNFILASLVAWLVAYAIYLVVSVILRTVNAIGG